MNFVCSTLEYVTPSSENLEIEDGLCSPNNQEVFLTASMAFLQTQLIKKLTNDIRTRFEKKYLPRKTYSDLLLVESQSKFRRKKYFIRVKNVEQYDEVLKNEATTPRQTLSLNQILPAPKKTLWLNPPRIFKTKSSKINLEENVQTGKTGFFRNLKKNLFKTKKSSTLINDHPLNDINLRCQLYVNTLPSKTSISTLNSLKDWNKIPRSSTTSSLAINRIKMAPSFVNPWKTFRDDSSTLPASTVASGSIIPKTDSLQSLEQTKMLNESPSEISELLSGSLKPSLSETIREIKNHYSYIHRICNNLEAPSYETIKSSSTVNVLARCSAQTKLKPQQSKMSVFLEEDSESEIEEEIRNYSSMCTNFTDEFKSRFSSQYLPSLFWTRNEKSKGDIW